MKRNVGYINMNIKEMFHSNQDIYETIFKDIEVTSTVSSGENIKITFKSEKVREIIGHKRVPEYLWYIEDGEVKFNEVEIFKV